MDRDSLTMWVLSRLRRRDRFVADFAHGFPIAASVFGTFQDGLQRFSRSAPFVQFRRSQQDSRLTFGETATEARDFGANRRSDRAERYAWVPDAVRSGEGSDRSVRDDGSRHSVSAKIRMEPPAVRMYSTFPAEIQL